MANQTIIEGVLIEAMLEWAGAASDEHVPARWLLEDLIETDADAYSMAVAFFVGKGFERHDAKDMAEFVTGIEGKDDEIKAYRHR